MKSAGYIIIYCLVACLALPVMAGAQKITPVYTGTLRNNSLVKVDSIKNEFISLLSKIYYVNKDNSSPKYVPDEQEVIFNQDNVVFDISKRQKYTYSFNDNQEIKISEYSYLGKVYQIVLPGLTVYWKIKDLEFARRFADILVYFQNMKNMETASDIKDFDSMAAEYRSLKVKPALLEEARKYIVQANAMTQAKNYKKAIEYYNEAIRINAANPMAYNNQALLFAMIGRYNDAIICMKKYLKLAPDADDARAVQDKIYEYEAMMVK